MGRISVSSPVVNSYRVSAGQRPEPPHVVTVTTFPQVRGYSPGGVAWSWLQMGRMRQKSVVNGNTLRLGRNGFPFRSETFARHRKTPVSERFPSGAALSKVSDSGINRDVPDVSGMSRHRVHSCGAGGMFALARGSRGGAVCAFTAAGEGARGGYAQPLAPAMILAGLPGHLGVGETTVKTDTRRGWREASGTPSPRRETM